MRALHRARAGVTASSGVALAVILATIGACHGEPPVSARGLATSSGSSEPAATAATAAQTTSAGEPAKDTGEAYFTGRNMTVADAKKAAPDIVIGELLDPGKANPDAPGQTYHDGARLRVITTLSGSLAPKKEVTFAYTRQVIPAEDAESAPVQGERYVFFLVSGKDAAYRALKILRANDANLKLVSP